MEHLRQTLGLSGQQEIANKADILHHFLSEVDQREVRARPDFAAELAAL